LGVSQEYYNQEVVLNKRGLRHQEVEVLGIEIMTSTRGELIASKLEKITEKVGKPKQIVSDQGSDLYKGIQLYQEKNPELIHTYDVTHQMALLIKWQLESDEKYQLFVSQCHQCRQEVQQTELSFLSPPSSRTKSRYFNLDKLINWGNKVLLYEEKQDFSWINESYIIDAEMASELVFTLKTKTLTHLLSLPEKTFVNREELELTLSKKLALEISSEEIQSILQAAELGRRRFLDKFGWLKEYQESLSMWTQMLEMTRLLETKLKTEGLNQQSLADFEQLFPPASIPEKLEQFYQKIRDYIIKQTSVLPDETNFLASSDIIESLFGKYKYFSQKCPIKELGRMILTIPLATLNFTADLVKQALETISSLDVVTWAEQMFGQSTLSKRKMVFSS